jgi:N-acetylneuraminic acid mutarotase
MRAIGAVMVVGLMAMAGAARAGQWEEEMPMPGGARHGGAVVAHDGKIYAMGGADLYTVCEEYDPATGAWLSMDNVPFACHMGRAVSDGTYVYLTGGKNNTTGLSTTNLYRFDPTAASGSQWALLAPMTTPRDGHGAVFAGGTIYVFGGMNEGNSGSAVLASVEAYSIAAGSWSSMHPMPRVAFGVTATTVAGSIYVIGGISEFALAGFHGSVLHFDPAGGSGAGSYTTLATMPVATTVHGAAAVNGVIYVTGGMSADVLTGAPGGIEDVQIYDPASDAWITGPALPEPRNIHDSCAIDETVYVIGGSDHTDSTATCYAHVAGNAQWRTREPMAAGARHGVAVVEHGGKMYVIGGADLLTVVEEYDPATDAWLLMDDVPFECHMARAVSDGTHIYLTGGSDASTGLSTAALYRFDPNASAGSQWTPLASMATAREGHGAVLVDGMIYVFAGVQDETTPLDSVEAYDVAGNVWSSKTPLPYAAFAVTATVADGEVFVMGGLHDFVASGFHDDVYRFDPSGNAGAGSWTALADMPAARAAHAAAAADGLIYVTGGLTGDALSVGADAVASVDIYDPALDAWTSGPELPDEWRVHGSCAIDGVVYVVGGEDGEVNHATCYAHLVTVVTPDDPATPVAEDESGSGCAPTGTATPGQTLCVLVIMAALMMARRTLHAVA